MRVLEIVDHGDYNMFELNGKIAGQAIFPNTDVLKFKTYEEGIRVANLLYFKRSFGPDDRAKAVELLRANIAMPEKVVPIEQGKRHKGPFINRHPGRRNMGRTVGLR